MYRGITTRTRNLYIHELQHKTEAIVQIRIYIFGSSSIRRSSCSTKYTTKVSLLLKPNTVKWPRPPTIAFRYKVSIHREVPLQRIRITSNRKIRSKFVCSLSRPIEWLVLHKISYNCLSKVRDCLLCEAIFHRGCYQSNRAWLTR